MQRIYSAFVLMLLCFCAVQACSTEDKSGSNIQASVGKSSGTTISPFRERGDVCGFCASEGDSSNCKNCQDQCTKGWDNQCTQLASSMDNQPVCKQNPVACGPGHGLVGNNKPSAP